MSLHQISGSAWIIKAHITKEARSLYNYYEYVTYIYEGTKPGLDKILKGLQENTVGGKRPMVKKVA